MIAKLSSNTSTESGTVMSTENMVEPPAISSGSISLIVGPLNCSVLWFIRSDIRTSARSTWTVCGKVTILITGLLISAFPLFRT